MSSAKTTAKSNRPGRTCGSGVKPPPMRASRMGRYRATVLIAVHVAFAIHLAHWLSTGRTVSPVEPSESMYFIEKGDLNAGVIFFATALLLTAVFGRFFCGWGCHLVALQDFCGFLLKKIGLRPKLFRSRLLMYVPLIVGLEMFFWQSFKLRVLARIIDDPDWKTWFGVAVIEKWQRSNQLMTEDFWATFAGPWMAIPFLLVCGFATVYFLGAKGFCTYGCPYGAFFAGADRLAAGKIVANLDTCEKCGHCTANCTSNVRIHEEIQIWGKVVSPACMKCMDCISVCPTGSLSFGFTKPKLLSQRVAGGKRKRKSFDLTFGEEVGLFVLFFAVRYAWRSVYHQIPMLMATALAGCVVFLVWKTLRLIRDRDVSFHHFALKREERWGLSGRILAGVTAVLLAATLFAGFAKWHQEQSEWTFDRLIARQTNLDQAIVPGFPPIDPAVREIAARGAADTRWILPIGYGGAAFASQKYLSEVLPRLGYFRAIAGDLPGAREALEQALALSTNAELSGRYGQIIHRLSLDAYLADGVEAGLAVIDSAIESRPEEPVLAFLRSHLLAQAGRADESAEWLRRAEQLEEERNRRAISDPDD